ncbi:hypothetical protein ACFSKL_23130 [Belliella marina]|uniref:Uncharacterized protein n=1 Tax=Belliella marina TaxID=1644146 RepID=A0ABW4VWK7_9BACT
MINYFTVDMDIVGIEGSSGIGEVLVRNLEQKGGCFLGLPKEKGSLM